MQEIGAKTPIVILSYRNCKLHCCHLDGYNAHTAALLARLHILQTQNLRKDGLFDKPLETTMVTKSPSGALSPYYYKGGYFHGIHYGSYFDDTPALLCMMQKEEDFILKSPQKRRILIDLYETNLTVPLLCALAEHVTHISPRVTKLAVSATPKSLRQLKKQVFAQTPLGAGQVYFCPDMEEAKTWLVSE